MPNLKDLTTKIGSGSTPRGGKSAYIDSGIPIIRSQNIIDLSFHESGLAFISEEQARAMEGVSVHLNDVLLNITGDSTARVAIWNRRQQARVNQHVAIIRANPDQLDPYWLMYWLYSPEVKQHLLMLASSGASRAALTKGMLEQLELPDFSVRQQQSISAPLRALDDKITANVRVLATANELVKNLYTAIPKSSNHAIESIGELVKKNVKPEEMDESKALINLEHFDSKQIWISRHTQVPEATSAKSSFLVGDVLFGKLRPYFHKVGVAPIGGYCSTDVLVVRPREDSYRGLLLAAMSAEETVAIATQNSNGTRMPRAKWADIASCAIPDPDDPKSIELGKLMDVLIPKCNALIHENHVLARTRDELLPLLMSGRITVGEAEKAANVADTAASES
ncbi:hypothetical protein ACL1HT_06335 [Corynebacterium striatum]|uniref:hypothetical protein n=1 Tax=Corynebacterium striatum TaxID=43770 RepID=UPI0034D7681A|nr:restriction endonuclease subunit S [Corynebacterium striatum]